MRARNSVKWTARTGVTPGTSGSSVNGGDRVTVTVNDCDALRPYGSVAVTVILARADAAAAVSVTRAPAARTVTTAGADDEKA